MAATGPSHPRRDAKKQSKNGQALVDKTSHSEQPPAAGAHATKNLSNPDATPGAGTLQAPDAKDDMGGTG